MARNGRFRALAAALSVLLLATSAAELYGRYHSQLPPAGRAAPAITFPGTSSRPGLSTPLPATPDTGSTGPPLATDALLLGGGTVAFGLAAPWIRPHLLEHFSLDRVRRNLEDPIGRLDAADGDDFFHNYVSHPLVWGGLGVVLRERGYGPWAAFGMTQAHSVWWEYVVEGAWKPPSRVDVITNFVSPAVSIFALYPVAKSLWGESSRAEEGSASGGLNSRLPPAPAGDRRGATLVVSVSVP